MAIKTLELSDIQRLILYGLARLPRSLYALCRIDDPALAGAWLEKELNDQRIAGADSDDAAGGTHQLFVAFTCAGLAELGLSGNQLRSFLPEFQQGMIGRHRARVIGDPPGGQGWRWGSVHSQVHLLCAAYATDDAQLPAWHSSPPPGCSVVRLVRAGLADTEPFGFADGLSQPYVEGSGRSDNAIPDQDRVAAGEFILGYKNAVGVYPASPWIEDHPWASGTGQLPTAPLSSARDLGKNGSFLVVRELTQDTAAFARLRPETRARIVGRWPDGEPLVNHPPDAHPALPVPDHDTTGNEFGYFENDAAGLRCPLGAHIRRANPRDALSDASLGVTPSDALRLANQHRLLRRSRRFDDAGESGLFFMCFNTNIERQFEFVQQTWLNNPKFGGASAEVDPLVGSAGRDFTLRSGPQRQRVQCLAEFVSVVGGAYFFMPGLRSLRYLAQLGRNATQQAGHVDPKHSSYTRVHRPT